MSEVKTMIEENHSHDLYMNELTYEKSEAIFKEKSMTKLLDGKSRQF